MKQKIVTVEKLIAMGDVIVIHRSSNFKYYANVAKLNKYFSLLFSKYVAYFKFFYQDMPHLFADSIEEIMLKAKVSCPELHIVEVMKQDEMPDGQVFKQHFYACESLDIMNSSVQVHEVMA